MGIIYYLQYIFAIGSYKDKTNKTPFFNGSEIAFSHAFDQAGSYRLTVKLFRHRVILSQKIGEQTMQVYGKFLPKCK